MNMLGIVFTIGIVIAEQAVSSFGFIRNRVSVG